MMTSAFISPKNNRSTTQNSSTSISTLSSRESTENNSPSLLHSFLAQWNKRKSQISLSSSDTRRSSTNEEISSEGDSNCHVCNLSLQFYRLHYCRNCNLPVCGVHSRNQVPLPHLGVLKEVRVCDLCIRALVQRRAGGGWHTQSKGVSLTPESSEKSLNESKNETLPSDQRTRKSSSAKELQLLSPAPGVLYSCLVEEQDNTMDDLLYLGTFHKAGHSLVSRTKSNANIAIWKDRWFMLTPAEILCFKSTTHEDGCVALGEVRSSIHLTDMVHVEIDHQYPRILTIVRSNGRLFRMRTRTKENCSEILEVLTNALSNFQRAMWRLSRGVKCPEDYDISVVTLQHASSLPEAVLTHNLALQTKLSVDMFLPSILRFYVSGPESTKGVVSISREMLLSSIDAQVPLSIEAESTATNTVGGHSPSDIHLVINMTLESVRIHKEPTPSILPVSLAYILPLTIAVASYIHLSYRFAITTVFLSFLVSAGPYIYNNREAFKVYLAIRQGNTRRNHSNFTLPYSLRIQIYVSAIQAERPKSDENLQISGSDDEMDGMEMDPRFLEGCNGDMEEAKERFRATIQWRKENSIDTILTRPLPQFATMKSSFKHAIHKRCKLGNLITIDYLGSMKSNMESFVAAGVTEEQAIEHYVFIQEYISNVLDPRVFPEGRQIKIVDIQGISMSDISGDVFSYMKELSETIAHYNPERMYRIFIVNPPSWFSLLWKVVSPLITPKTRDRVAVLRGQKSIQKSLLEFINPENLPAEYGGTCECPGGCFAHSPEENDLAQYVDTVNKAKDNPDGKKEVEEKLHALCVKYRDLLPPGSECPPLS